jgi:hypothetical protein
VSLGQSGPATQAQAPAALQQGETKGPLLRKDITKPPIPSSVEEKGSIGVPALVFDDEWPFSPLTYALRVRAGRVFAFGRFKEPFFAIAPNPSCVGTEIPPSVRDKLLKGFGCKNWERSALNKPFAME